MNEVEECSSADAHREHRRGDIGWNALAHHDRQRDDADRDCRADTVHRREQKRGDERDGHRGGQRPVPGKLDRRTDHAFRDSGLNQHLGEPGAEYDDDHGARILNAAALDDFFLDLIDADSGDGRPQYGEDQKHDDGALTANDRHDHRKKRNHKSETGCKLRRHNIFLPRC